MKGGLELIIHNYFLRKIALQIDGFLLIDMSSFVPRHGDTCMAIEIIFIVLPTVIDQKVLFLINQPKNVTPACLKIRSQLNG